MGNCWQNGRFFIFDGFCSQFHFEFAQKMMLPDEGKFKLILSLTGHNFSFHSTPIRRQIHLVFIFFILAIGIYQCLWFLYNNVLRCGINLFMFRFMIWTSKGIIVQLILLHLQFSGQIDKLAKIVFRQNYRIQNRKIYWFLGFSLAIYLFLMVTGLVYFLLRICKIVDAGYHFKYGSLSAIFIRNFMWWVSMWIVTSALVLYNFCVQTVVQDAEEFGKEIEFSDMEKKAASVKCPFSEFHKRHIRLMKEVDCLNDTFKVYLFFMIGLNIPITISTLLRLLKSPMAGPLQYLFIVPENLFCWFELIALTALAAKLNILLRKIPKTFYMNLRMDGILDGQNKLTGPIRALFFHSTTNLGTLGLTLWEFTTITKPLIMTVVSLVASYLTVIFQVIPVDLEERQFMMNENLNLTILC